MSGGAESNHRSLASNRNQNFSVKFSGEDSLRCNWGGIEPPTNPVLETAAPDWSRVCALTQRTEASCSRQLSKVAVDKWFAIQIADSSRLRRAEEATQVIDFPGGTLQTQLLATEVLVADN